MDLTWVGLFIPLDDQKVISARSPRGYHGAMPREEQIQPLPISSWHCHLLGNIEPNEFFFFGGGEEGRRNNGRYWSYHNRDGSKIIEFYSYRYLGSRLLVFLILRMVDILTQCFCIQALYFHISLFIVQEKRTFWYYVSEITSLRPKNRINTELFLEVITNN